LLAGARFADVVVTTADIHGMYRISRDETLCLPITVQRAQPFHYLYTCVQYRSHLPALELTLFDTTRQHKRTQILVADAEGVTVIPPSMRTGLKSWHDYSTLDGKSTMPQRFTQQQLLMCDMWDDLELSTGAG